MKPIPPTLKDKKRYVAFKVHSKEAVSKKQVIDSILKEALGFFGENRVSDFGIWIVDFNDERKDGYLVCNHRFKGDMITTLTLINSIANQRASVHVLGVSGTIKSLKRKFLNDGSNMSELKGENKYATDAKHGI
jgi:ribonuclease P/MRP protein subunit POP5